MGKTVKAIITGATGGLGRNLTEALLARGWQVLACGRNAAIGAQLKTPFIAFDLSDRKQTLAAFQTADVVFHCAALSSPWGNYQNFYRANVSATENVTAAMQRHGIAKLVHVSTPSLYFDFTDRRNTPESYLAKRFANHYAATKYLAEQHVLQSGVESVIIRPRGIFGEHDTALLPRLIRVAQKGTLPLVVRHGREAGSALADVSYVGNVVHAMLLAAEKTLPSGSVFNITNGEPRSMADTYRMVAETLHLNIRFKPLPYRLLYTAASAMETAARLGIGGEPLLTRYSVGTISFDQTLDISAARQQLGYEPQVSVAEGLERYARFYFQAASR